MKFRIYDKIEKEHVEEPDHRWLLTRNGRIYNTEKDKYYDSGDRYIVEMFTGLQDKNGKDIYEGDKIEFDRKEWGGDGNIHTVSWDKKDGSWCWGGGCTSDMEWRAVIGNIHE